MTSHYNRRWLISIIGSSPNLDLILVNRLTIFLPSHNSVCAVEEFPPAPAANSSSGLLLRITAGQQISLPKEVKRSPTPCCLPPLWPRKWNCATFVSLLHLYLPGLVYNPTEAWPSLSCSSANLKQVLKLVVPSCEGCAKRLSKRDQQHDHPCLLGNLEAQKWLSLLALAQAFLSCCRLSLMRAFCGAQQVQKVFRSCLLRQLLEDIDLFSL